MSDQLIALITEQLIQEKWTRTALPNFTTQVFKDLDEHINQVFEENIQDEILGLCEEHLKQSKNSIVGLYVSGIINLRKQAINDANLLILINMFTENNRWKIAEWLAERILDNGANKHAYRTLIQCYEQEGNEQKKYEVWEKLIQVDYEEADIVRALAERAEAAGNAETAIAYYKKALHRYINRRMFAQVREIWKKLIERCPAETEFFYHAEGKAAKIMSEDRAVMLLEDLYPWYRDQQRWDTAIDILKRVLAYDPKSPTARSEIVSCYKAKHQGHSQLDEYIRLSNLSASWRPIQEAIADFEKHISFDAGNYVFHRTWGVGLITSIKDDFITIDFPKTKGHKMSLKLAVSALTILGKEHFWVYRITMKPERLKEKILKNEEWALKVIIKSFDNQADMKRVKAELADSKLLTASEWTSFSTKARKILQTSESFGNLPDKPDTFVVRDQPISMEEKTANSFKAEKDFFKRVKIVQDFLADVEDKEMHLSIDTDMFRDMFEYFVGYVRNMSQVNEVTLASLLLVTKVSTKYPFLNPNVSVTYREVFEAIGEGFEEIFTKLANADLRREFLKHIKKTLKNWPETYLKLLPLQLNKENITDLVNAGYVPQVQTMFTSAFGAYRDHREMAAWFIRNCFDDEWFVSLNLPLEKILIAMIHLYDLSLREIDNKKDLVENRRLSKSVHTFLFKEEMLAKFLATGSLESVTRVYNLLNDAKKVDSEIYKPVRQAIKERFPEFRFAGDHDKEREIETVSRSGFFTLMRSYEEKQKALQALMEIEVPKNSKEIAVARDYGDLRENAEYKAAKERQEILNSTAAKWKAELEQAKPINQTEIDNSRIGFGTVVTLKNNNTKKNETYTIMGPWESNPDEGIISYLSPFGLELFRKSVDDELKFTINERPYSYTVKKIEKAKLEAIKTTTAVTV
jgi:transcription elongation factor GreA